MNGFAGLVNFACFLSLLTAIGLRGLHLHGEDNRLRERERGTAFIHLYCCL